MTEQTRNAISNLIDACDALAAKYSDKFSKYFGKAEIFNEVHRMEQAVAAARAALAQPEQKYTTGHCPHKKAVGGCQLHNLQCGYPDCDRKVIEQTEQRGEVVASVKDSLTVRAAFEAWLAWWSTLPNDRDKHGYCDMTVEMLSHAYAAGMTRSAQVGQRGEAVPIKQFRVKGGAAWNDGLPPTDHYETRTLYTAPPAPEVPRG